MRIGIIIYSETGNTLSVAQGIIERLTAAGNVAVLERVSPIGKPNPSVKQVSYERIPDLGVYDAFVFGSPVQAFSLALGMSRFIPQLSALNGKRAAVFATQQLPFAWLGGNRALSQMGALLKEKGASVYNAGSVNWSSKARQDQIESVIDNAVRQLLV
jgi:flavodoxin